MDGAGDLNWLHRFCVSLRDFRDLLKSALQLSSGEVALYQHSRLTPIHSKQEMPLRLPLVLTLAAVTNSKQ